MARKLIDLTGQKFGRLTVLYRAKDYITKTSRRKFTSWHCKCDCGNEIDVIGSSLKSGYTNSCGCLSKESKKKYNTYDLSGEYGIGYTSKGEEFYFDLEDYDKIKDYCWCLNGDEYVVARTIDGKRNTILFHRLLFPESKMVDHIDHNTRNNQKGNLREVVQQQNSMNHKISKSNTSGVTGVDWSKAHNLWRARICFKGNEISLGYHVDFEDAVKARKKAEEKYFGEYKYNVKGVNTCQD